LVRNSAQIYATKYYQYVVPTNCSIVQKDTITIDLTVDTRINNRIYFPKLGSYINPQQNTIRVYGDIKGVHSDSIVVPVQMFAFNEGTVRYLYSVTGVPNQSHVLDTIDPLIKVTYYIDKLKYSPVLGTTSWNDSLWEVYKNDVVYDIYERF
jgi:hypothetical protein